MMSLECASEPENPACCAQGEVQMSWLQLQSPQVMAQVTGVFVFRCPVLPLLLSMLHTTDFRQAVPSQVPAESHPVQALHSLEALLGLLEDKSKSSMLVDHFVLGSYHTWDVASSRGEKKKKRFVPTEASDLSRQAGVT